MHCDPGKADESFDSRYRAFVQDSTGARLVDTKGLDPYDVREMEGMGLSTRRWGFMLALDADRFSPDFMKSFIQECPDGGGEAERIFRHADSGEDFGAFVSMPQTEYEFGKSRYWGRFLAS